MLREYPVTRKIDPMGTITVNLDKVIQKKREALPDEKLTAERIALHTGLALNTVRAWLRRSIKSADLQTLATFCDFFDCDPSDILEYQPDASSDSGSG